MTPCVGSFPRSNRPCLRPADHEGEHGHLVVDRRRFDKPRRVAEYRGQAGDEVGGHRLSPAAFDALAASITTGNPPELVAVGEYVREDGRSWLDYAESTAYIEATTEWRWDAVNERLRWVCPSCGLKDDKHVKSCELS